MKVLICAYACDPYWGSEAGVGWQWSSLASMNHDVWVITDADNQSNIEQYLAQDHLPNLHFVYVKKTFFSAMQKNIFKSYLYLLGGHIFAGNVMPILVA